MSEYALTGPEAFGTAVSATIIVASIAFLQLGSPERTSRRLSGTSSNHAFKRFARWARAARGFWVLLLLLALGLASDIAKVFSVRGAYAKFGFISFPVLNMTVVIQLLRLHWWAKAQAE